MTHIIRRGERGIPRATNANLVKSWIQFRCVAKHLRCVFLQLDGEIELADACTCTLDWEPFRVSSSDDCPIDQHRLASQRKAAA